MQTILAKLKLIGFVLIVGVACGSPSQRVLPTRLLPAQIGPLSTPTLSAAAPESQVTASAAVSNGIFAEGHSIGDPYLPELGSDKYDVQRYLLRLSLNPKVTSISGEAELEISSLEDGLEFITLDFVGFDVEQVQVMGMPVPFAREEKKLLIYLPRPLMSGDLFTVTITYQGEPVQESSPFVGYTDHLGLNSADDESMVVLSEPDGARYWFPNNDHPRDKAIFRFELTAPIGLTAVANGRLLEVREAASETLPGGGAGRTFVWEHRYPMASYLALVAVGPFVRLESTTPGGIPLRHYVTDPYQEELKTAVSDIAETIDWLTALLGPFPFETFGYVAADMPPTAMEYQTMVLMSNELIGKRTAVHELVHMWFGDWVSPNSWSEMWRKEGLATYITMLWETRDDPEAIDGRITDVLASVAENTPHYPIGYPPPEHLLGYNTYFKGAAFIHTLRRAVGDEAFFSGLRIYLQRYGGATASDAQFRQVLEEAAGFSLEAYFDAWLS